MTVRIKNIDTFDIKFVWPFWDIMQWRFKTKILIFVRPVPNSIFNCHHKLLGLRFILSHFLEHEFKYSSQDTFNSCCFCGNGESSSHCLLHCWLHLDGRTTFLDNITLFHPNILDRSDSKITQVLSFGKPSLIDQISIIILNLPFDYVISTKRFEEKLFIDNCYEKK